MNTEYSPYKDMPYLAVKRKDEKGVITVAYDEINPIEYFGKPLKEYCLNYFGSFSEMVKAAISEYDKIKKMDNFRNPINILCFIINFASYGEILINMLK